LWRGGDASRGCLVDRRCGAHQTAPELQADHMTWMAIEFNATIRENFFSLNVHSYSSYAPMLALGQLTIESIVKGPEPHMALKHLKPWMSYSLHTDLTQTYPILPRESELVRGRLNRGDV
jgi:hypothetical protein